MGRYSFFFVISFFIWVFCLLSPSGICSELKPNENQIESIKAYLSSDQCLKTVRFKHRVHFTQDFGEDDEFALSWSFYEGSFCNLNFYLKQLTDFEDRTDYAGGGFTTFTGVSGNKCWQISQDEILTYQFEEDLNPDLKFFGIEHDVRNPVDQGALMGGGTLTQVLCLGVQQTIPGSFLWQGLKFEAKGHSGEVVKGRFSEPGGDSLASLLFGLTGSRENDSDYHYRLEFGKEMISFGGGRIPSEINQYVRSNGAERLLQEIVIESVEVVKDRIEAELFSPDVFFKKYVPRLTVFTNDTFLMQDGTNWITTEYRDLNAYESIRRNDRALVIWLLIILPTTILFWVLFVKSKRSKNAFGKSKNAE